jgi:hypothetical protein
MGITSAIFQALGKMLLTNELFMMELGGWVYPWCNNGKTVLDNANKYFIYSWCLVIWD